MFLNDAASLLDRLVVLRHGWSQSLGTVVAHQRKLKLTLLIQSFSLDVESLRVEIEYNMVLRLQPSVLESVRLKLAICLKPNFSYQWIRSGLRSLSIGVMFVAALTPHIYVHLRFWRSHSLSELSFHPTIRLPVL